MLIALKHTCLSTLFPSLLQVLDDAALLQDAGYTEAGGFIVVMSKAVKKAAPPPKPAASAAGAATPSAPAPAAPADPADPYTAGASALVTGGDLEATVASIVEMGFPRDDALRALRAAFNNPERAVEYLMTGIPETAPGAAAEGGAAAAGGTPSGAVLAAAPAAPAAAGAPPDAPAGPNTQPLDLFGGGGGGGGGGGAAGAASSPLDFLRVSPQFTLLRSVVAANPAALQPLLTELGRAQPDLLALINANQADFLRLLNEPPAPGAADAAATMLGGGGGGEGGAPPGSTVVELTQEEADAVGRLEALGFSRQAVLEAYLACDKDESLAANFLFDNGDAD